MGRNVAWELDEDDFLGDSLDDDDDASEITLERRVHVASPPKDRLFTAGGPPKPRAVLSRYGRHREALQTAAKVSKNRHVEEEEELDWDFPSLKPSNGADDADDDDTIVMMVHDSWLSPPPDDQG